MLFFCKSVLLDEVEEQALLEGAFRVLVVCE